MQAMLLHIVKCCEKCMITMILYACCAPLRHTFANLMLFFLIADSKHFSCLPSRAAISRDPFYEMLAARKKKVSSMKRH